MTTTNPPTVPTTARSQPLTAGARRGGAVSARYRRPFRLGRGNGAHYLLIAPALVLSLSVVLLPAVFTAITAFTDFNGVDIHANFVGLGNFREILADSLFWEALRHNVIWTALFLTVPVVLGMGTALLLLRRPRVRSLYQVLFLLPYVMAAITNGIIWLNIIYSPTAGLLAYLQQHGIDLPSPIANPSTALFGVAAVDIWHYWGFLTVVYLAALRQTPAEQVEAALLEGANGLQLFRYVYLPNIWATVQLMFVMIIIFSFLAFDYVYLMTQGGPAHGTEMLSTYAYTFAFATFSFGKAAAVGLVMSLFGLFASFIFAAISRRDLTA